MLAGRTRIERWIEWGPAERFADEERSEPAAPEALIGDGATASSRGLPNLQSRTVSGR
jgi:hypothetical protein